MSTDYYIVCKDHDEHVPAASRTISKNSLFSSDELLATFIISHNGCNVGIVTEHDKPTTGEVDDSDIVAMVDRALLESKWR